MPPVNAILVESEDLGSHVRQRSQNAGLGWAELEGSWACLVRCPDSDNSDHWRYCFETAIEGQIDVQ
jgi:hypothetical protein